jgi:hypothetical protein
VFHEQISALHKSVRGSDPDAALYWLARMLDGGCDPAYVARRIVRMASEDIGNADPRAMTLALDAWQTWERLGTPEGELALAHAVVFLACAAKSNAVYTAWQAAQAVYRPMAPGGPAPATRLDRAGPQSRAWPGLSLRPRRAGCLRGGGQLFPGGAWAACLLPAGTTRPRATHRRKTGRLS